MSVMVVLFLDMVSQIRRYSQFSSGMAFPRPGGILYGLLGQHFPDQVKFFLVCYSWFMLVVENTLCMLGKIMNPIFDKKLFSNVSK